MRFQRMQVPFLLFLEILTILLLVLAAAEPNVLSKERSRPLVVVLDDSFSMLAGKEETSKTRAEAALLEELHRDYHNPVYFVLAGETPRVLGEPIEGKEISSLAGWRGLAPSSNLEEAIGFAFEIGGRRAHILVITDQAPPQNLQPFIEATLESSLQWWAFGSPQPNGAFVNAHRTPRDGQDHCLLEIANLSTHIAKTTLYVDMVNLSQTMDNRQQTTDNKSWTYELNPYETRKIFLECGRATALHARLDEDVLQMDNQVVLLPQVEKRVRVEIRIQDNTLRTLVERAVQTTRMALLTATDPELILTDQEEIQADGLETWTMRIIAEKDAEAYGGPFVVNRSHPLTEGFSPGGVIWGGGKTEQIAGIPVITAGNIPLLTDIERFPGKHDLQMRLRLDLSTLQNTPNWPILIWNLVHWRADQLPGLKSSNLRLGTEALLVVASGTESVQVINPRGETQEMPISHKTVILKADDVGVYKIQTSPAKNNLSDGFLLFASNALYQEESDLSACTSGRWGNWVDLTSLQQEYKNLAWVFLLLAMGVLTVHMILLVHSDK